MAEEQKEPKLQTAEPDVNAIFSVACRMADDLPTPETIMYQISDQPDGSNTYGYPFDTGYVIKQGGITVSTRQRPVCK